MNDEPIRSLWRTMADGWGDAAQFAEVFAEDVDFVTVRGEELHGRAAVQKGHTNLFATVFRDTELVPEIHLIRPLTDDVVLVHVTTAVTPAGPLTHAQAIVSRRPGGWTITAFHNMIPHLPGGTPR